MGRLAQVALSAEPEGGQCQRPHRLGVICGVRDKREAGSSPDCRTHLDFMLQEFRSAVHDKQSEPEAIRTCRFEAVKSLKDIFQLLWGHAQPRIVKLDPNARNLAT